MTEIAPSNNSDNYAAIDMTKMIGTIKQSLHKTINTFLDGEGIDILGFTMPDGSFMLHPTIAKNITSYVKGEMINNTIVEHIAKTILNDLISTHIEG